MVIANIKDLQSYVEQKKKSRADEHRRRVLANGMCGGLTDKEYNRIVVRQKSSFAKSRKFTHTRMWQDHHKVYNVKQLEIIKKTL